MHQFSAVFPVTRLSVAGFQRLHQLPHRRFGALAGAGTQRGEARDDGGDLRNVETDGWGRTPDRQAHPAAAALLDRQGDPTESQPFDIARHRPGGDPELGRQFLQAQAPTTSRVQALDQRLLALDPAQREVPVPGLLGESMSLVHGSHRKADTGVSGLLASVESMTNTTASTTTRVQQFFDRYAAALLARDEQAIAQLYAVPALILFPGNAIPVSDAAQTERFFKSSWQQYEGVDEASSTITVLAETPGSIWADVTWSFGGAPRERFCYQLVAGPDGDRIAVLTPMG